MANIGTAQLTITPKFDHLSEQVNRAIAGLDVSSGSSKLGSSISSGISHGMGGMAKSGALIGVFSQATSKAMDIVSDHVGSAVSRLDTLKNYPVVMSNLGVASEEASSSMQMMSDRLSNLPTSLNDMATTVQGLYTSARNYGMSLTDVTKAGLGLNDMLLAGGQSQAIVNAAVEQFRQMVSKGKPEMQDWRSLMMAAPAQLDQLAKAMLGPTANANDLYAALGGGKNDPTISMSQLLAKIAELDTQGGEGITSFKEQAESAQAGIQTAFNNMSNAVTKGLANVMDTIGRGNIAGVLNDTKTLINEMFGDIASSIDGNRAMLASDAETIIGIVRGGAEQVRGILSGSGDEIVGIVDAAVKAGAEVAPVVSGIVEAAGPLLPALIGVKAGLKGIEIAKDVFSPLASGAKLASSASGMLSGKLLDLATTTSGKLSDGLLAGAGVAEKFAGIMSGPWGLAISAGAAGIGLLVGKCMEMQQKQDELNASVSAFGDAMDRAADISTFSGALGDISSKTHDAKVDLDDFNRTMESHAKAIDDSNAKAEEQIATMTTVQQTIDGSIGKTDLDTAAKGRLEWALKTLNDQTGLNITTEDVLAGKYTDQNGVVQDLRQSVDDLTNARINQAKTDALQSNLTEEYKAQTDAANAYAQAQNAVNDIEAQTRESAQATADKMGLVGQQREDYIEGTIRDAVARSDANRQLQAASQDYDAATTAIENTSAALGLNTAAAQEGADAYTQLIASLPILSASLEAAHVDAGGFADTLRSLGVDAQSFTDQLKDQPELLSQLANDYDGTSASIVDDLHEWGVGMDESAAKAAELSRQISDGMGISASQLSEALQAAGISTTDFASALDAAGISAENMSAISQEQFAAMLSNCGGNLDALIMDIQNYNGQPITDKDGSVDVDTSHLMDAQGQVYTWNGTTLVDQNGQAVVDDVSLIDAQGNLWTWNGSSLVQQDGTADVNDVTLVDAQGHLYTWNGSELKDQDGVTSVTGNLPDALGWIAQWNNVVLKPLHGVIDIVQNIFGGGGNGNARGGVVARGHATGAIFTKPTWISPTDYIGEAGAEYYDGTNIVPLTNRRYSQPFADIIADSVVRRWGSERNARSVVQNVTQNIYERDDAYVASTIASRSLMRAAQGA